MIAKIKSSEDNRERFLAELKEISNKYGYAVGFSYDAATIEAVETPGRYVLYGDDLRWESDREYEHKSGGSSGEHKLLKGDRNAER